MKHHKKTKKLGRKADARRALIRSLVFNLIKNGKIKTTEAKAKAVKPIVEKLISKAKNENLSGQKLLIARAGKATARKLANDIASKYKSRNGGYTRIIKMPARKGDASKMAIIELV